MLQLMCTFQVLGVRAVESLRRRMRDDRGQTAAEYMGIVVIVAIIIAAIVATKPGQTIANDIKTKIQDIFQSQ